MVDSRTFLLPWEFSPLAFVLFFGLTAAYIRGLRRCAAAGRPEGYWRRTSFFVGMGLMYFVMQTHYDFLAQHMFFLHRIQHLVLHHLGAFLVALAQPQRVLASGMPSWLMDRVFRPIWRHPAVQRTYRALQNAVVAPVLFVGIIFFWLTPSIHFYAMLSDRLYWVMNWSMLFDGLLFWFLMLDPRSKAEGALLGHGTRVIILLVAILPQIALGAFIGTAAGHLYDVYGLCGRAWDLSPLADEHLGGLTTWIPAGMMHLVAALVVLGMWMHADRGTAAPGPGRLAKE